MRVARGSETTRRDHGDLESEVLRQLWRSQRPLTPGEMRERIDGDLAYTTVMTVLSRLHDKGLALRERDGRAYRYRPARDAAELAAERMHEVLANGEDRVAVLTRFAGSLSPADNRALRAAMRRSRQPDS